MAEDARGKGKHLGGKIKEEAGELLGDREMEREGQLDQVEGQAQQDEARAEEKAREARRREAAARKARESEDL